MTAEPINGFVLCKLANAKEHKVEEKGIVYQKSEFPIYEVVKSSPLSIGIDLASGDMIATNSVPTKVKIEDQELYLISQDYIAAKVQAD